MEAPLVGVCSDFAGHILSEILLDNSHTAHGEQDDHCPGRQLPDTQQ